VITSAPPRASVQQHHVQHVDAAIRRGENGGIIMILIATAGQVGTEAARLLAQRQQPARIVARDPEITSESSLDVETTGRLRS
jgi:hypothetical protein